MKLVRQYTTKTIIYSIASLGLFGVVFYIYKTYNPSNFSFFPTCPFFDLTGFQCPGCGLQRALHHLFNGQFWAAFQYNPLFFFLLPYLIVLISIRLGLQEKKHPKLFSLVHHQWSGRVVVISILSFWILRNLN